MLGQSLLDAIECDDAAAVESLLAAGADANARASSGATALTRAAAKGNAAVVDALLRGGADVESKRGDGMTALMLASFFGHTGVVAALLQHRADVSAQDKTSMTALKWAQAKGQTGVCALLKTAADAGAAAGRPAPRGDSPEGGGPLSGVEDEPRAAAESRETKRAESPRDEAAEEEITVISSRPSPPTAPSAEDTVTRPAREAAPMGGVLGEGLLFNAGASTRSNRVRYYVGATCAVVFFLTGFLYTLTEGFTKVPADSAPPVQAPPPPAVRSGPAEARPDSARPVPARTPPRPSAVRPSDGQGAAPTGGDAAPRLTSTALAPRKPGTELVKDTPPAQERVVKRAEAEPASPTKPEARKPAARPISENNNEARVTPTPRPSPPQSKARLAVPTPPGAPAAIPSRPAKKKVIPWP